MIFFLGAAGAIILYHLIKGIDMHQGKHGPETFLNHAYRVSDFLYSSTIPALKVYHLDDYELDNVKRLADAIRTQHKRFGRPVITSGGRPQRLADFVSILRKKGYKAVDDSQHNEFAAADMSWGTPVTNYQAFEAMKATGLFHQLILTMDLRKDGTVMSYVHASVSDARRPGVKQYYAVHEDPKGLLEKVLASPK